MDIFNDIAFSPEPLFLRTASYTTSISNSNGTRDEVDIYYPIFSDLSTAPKSVALFLQGAQVDKSNYSNYANLVASYGFVVVIPNHKRTLNVSFPHPTGLYSEQQQINDVLAFVQAENLNLSSPINGMIDTNKLSLLGHSFGASVGLGAIQATCTSIRCTTNSFIQPEQLKAGIFYGTIFSEPPGSGNIPPINNLGIPLGLIAGNRDSIFDWSAVKQTYHQIQNSPKVLVTLKNANHYGITNTNNPPGSVVDPNSPQIVQAVATETIARWSALFLRAMVLNDLGAYNYIFHGGDRQDPNVTIDSSTKFLL